MKWPGRAVPVAVSSLRRGDVLVVPVGALAGDYPVAGAIPGRFGSVTITLEGGGSFTDSADGIVLAFTPEG